MDATTARLEQTLQALVARMKQPRKPINLVISGPPGYDTSVLCHFLKRECGFDYVSIDPKDDDIASVAAAAPGAEAAAAAATTTKYYSRHDVERAQGIRTYRRHLRETERLVDAHCRVPSVAADGQLPTAETQTRVFVQHTLNLTRFQLRHLSNIPTSDSMLNADRGVWERSLWRIFHGAPNDETYGHVCTSRSMRLLDDTMHAALNMQGKLSLDVMFKDCSPSNTLWVYVAPSQKAYGEIVELSIQRQDGAAVAEASRQYYWQTYSYLERMYRQSDFTTMYWSLLLQTESNVFDTSTMLNVGIVVLEYLVDTLMHHEFWGCVSKQRELYLSTTSAMSARVKFVPQSAPSLFHANTLNIPQLDPHFAMSAPAPSSSRPPRSASGASLSATDRRGGGTAAAQEDASMTLSSSSSSSSISRSASAPNVDGAGAADVHSPSSSKGHHHHHRRHDTATADDRRLHRVRNDAALDPAPAQQDSRRRLSLPPLVNLREPVNVGKEKTRLARSQQQQQQQQQRMAVVDLSV